MRTVPVGLWLSISLGRFCCGDERSMRRCSCSVGILEWTGLRDIESWPGMRETSGRETMRWLERRDGPACWERLRMERSKTDGSETVRAWPIFLEPFMCWGTKGWLFLARGGSESGCLEVGKRGGRPLTVDGKREAGGAFSRDSSLEDSTPRRIEDFWVLVNAFVARFRSLGEVVILVRSVSTVLISLEKQPRAPSEGCEALFVLIGTRLLLGTTRAESWATSCLETEMCVEGRESRSACSIIKSTFTRVTPTLQRWEPVGRSSTRWYSGLKERGLLLLAYIYVAHFSDTCLTEPNSSAYGRH